MSQVQVLADAMKRGWLSTAGAFDLGITSFHRRLCDFRAAHWQIREVDDGVTYLVKGKSYRLASCERNVKTRWGKTQIKLWRLVLVK